MQKKSKKSADLEIERSEKRKSPGGLSVKDGRHIFQELDAYLDAQAEIHRRNPPKTDYVLPNGKMLPVPANLLTSEKEVLDMYEHLHGFCCNSVTDRIGIIFRDHYHPIDCLRYMYAFGCISLKEMRAGLLIPIQIRLLHEHLYRNEFLDIPPYRKFVVEFVNMIRFILSLHGYVVPHDMKVRRYCYSWITGGFDFAGMPHSEDVIASSYENDLTQNKEYLREWNQLKSTIRVSKWAYGLYQDWFLVFDADDAFDPNLTQITEKEWKLTPEHSGVGGTESGCADLRSRLRTFCRRWALTHVGTPFGGDNASGALALRAGRVEVFPAGTSEGLLVSPTNPVGHEVIIPKFYAYSHIQEYFDRDFAQLKYAMQLVHSQRKAGSSMPNARKIELLRSLKKILKRNRASLGEIYRIQKGITGMPDSTLRKIGFAAPRMDRKYIDKGRVIRMRPEEMFAAVLDKTAHNQSDQRSAFEIMSHFGVHVDFLSCNAERDRLRV